MSLITPTTQEISDNIVSQIEASLGQSVPLLPKAFIRVMAKAVSGVVILLYKYAGFILLQMFVRTASYQETVINGVTLIPLVEWGRLIGVGDPIAATRAELLVAVTVETQTGFLPSNTQLIHATNGVTYITLSSVLLNASTVQVTVRASSDQAGGNGSGAIGNLAAAAQLTFANPIANVARAVTVVSQTVTGADAEEWETYRQRVIDRFQKQPQGGAYADYEAWGEEAAGIVNVYPYTSANPGQVDVYVEASVASSGSADGIPTAPQLQAVLDLINFDAAGLATRRPVGTLVNAFAITRIAFDVRVTDLVVDNAAAVQAEITTACQEFFLSAEPFIDGLTIPPRKDRLTRASLIGIVDDIVSAYNGTFTSVFVELTSGGSYLELYALQQGEKAKLGSIVFV